jgi:hypothetical protein
MHYQLIVIGAGPAGMMAAITAAREGKKVLLLEQLPKIGTKLKATGGGRCNLTNTLEAETFMRHFGRNGRFMQEALAAFDASQLVDFFQSLGVECHAPDGFRIFPLTHNASTIIDALAQAMHALNVEVLCHQKVQTLLFDANVLSGVKTDHGSFSCDSVVIATGGKGYPALGAKGDGYAFAKACGHTIVPPHPAMMPLKVKETWVNECRADTIAKVDIYVDIKKYKNRRAKGDLIFTKGGIRGPVVLDFSREITPLLAQYDEVPVCVNLTKGRNEEQIRQVFKVALEKDPQQTTLTLLETLLPTSVALALCALAKVDGNLTLSKQKGSSRDALYRLLVWTPLTITGHEGFKMAMITRGGVTLKEINPHTMQSKKVENLYFCGEVVDLDGPCGGYNLQWSFSSGYLAGKSVAIK